MQINLDESTYRRLCRVADYHGTYPAWIARRWVEVQLDLEEEIIRYRHRVGIQGGQPDTAQPEVGNPTLNPQPASTET